MKKYRSVKLLVMACIVMGFVFIINSSNNLNKKEKKINKVNITYTASSTLELTYLHNEDVNEIVYEGMTLKELGEKLEKNLKSNLKGYGHTFAKYSIEYEVDPYIATSIVLLETGCKWNCSRLVKKCNNIGGMKGKNKCSGSSYAKFETLDSGIEAYFKNLSNNYFKKGLTTTKEINKKYAENPEWYKKVDAYVEEIKSS